MVHSSIDLNSTHLKQKSMTTTKLMLVPPPPPPYRLDIRKMFVTGINIWNRPIPATLQWMNYNKNEMK